MVLVVPLHVRLVTLWIYSWIYSPYDVMAFRPLRPTSTVGRLPCLYGYDWWCGIPPTRGTLLTAYSCSSKKRRVHCTMPHAFDCRYCWLIPLIPVPLCHVSVSFSTGELRTEVRSPLTLRYVIALHLPSGLEGAVVGPVGCIYPVPF